MQGPDHKVISGLWSTKVSVCPLVRIGALHPLSRKRVCPSPPEQKGDGTHSPGGGGRGIPIRTTGEKVKYSVYSFGSESPPYLHDCMQSCLT
jgi:hypothetical protein